MRRWNGMQRQCWKTVSSYPESATPSPLLVDPLHHKSFTHGKCRHTRKKTVIAWNQSFAVFGAGVFAFLADVDPLVQQLLFQP
jgi:hypothetical protein